MKTEWNFCIGNDVRSADLEPIFGPRNPHNPNDEVHFVPQHMSLPHLLVMARIFPSKTLARKNGFPGPAPDGFTQLVLGKKRTLLTLWNPRQDEDNGEVAT